MSLKWKEIELVLAEARPFLEGTSVQKIAQSGQLAGGESFLLQGYNQERGAVRLWISLFQDKTCLALLPPERKPDTAKEPSTFVMVLRKHLLGQTIERVEQLANDRMAVLHFENGKSLLVVLIPRRANLALLEDWGKPERHAKCIGTFQKISLKPGALYELPLAPTHTPNPDVRAEIAAVEAGRNLALNHFVATLYWESLGETHFQSLKKSWQQAFKSFRKKVNNALEHNKRDLEQAREAALFQLRGKALFAQLYELGAKKMPKEKSIILEYNDAEGLHSIEVPLDKSKSYADNAELCFKKAKKFTRAVAELEQMVAELTEKLRGLDALGEKIAATDDETVLQTFRTEAEGLGLDLPLGEVDKNAGKAVEAKGFLQITSSDGFTILCGRNQEENRRVTFEECRGNDLWLHVKGMPGAHVVILAQKNKTVPLTTLLEAAQITLYHSKVRDGRKAEVDYTFRKNVKPIKGTLAEVTYTGNKALNVEASGEEYRKIVGRNSA